MQIRKSEAAGRHGRASSLAIALLSLLLALNGQAQQPAPQGCQLLVTTDPAGATVTCDGVAYQNAPVTLPGLTPGDHLLTALKEGYRELRRTVNLQPGQRIAVEMKLDPLQGLLLVHSTPSGAEVSITGVSKGKTPLLLTDLPANKYRLTLATPGYLSKDVEVDLADRTPKYLAVELESHSATLSVTSEPAGARVMLNGVDRGMAPCRLDRIPPGESTLELSLDGHQNISKTLQLRAGQLEEVSIQLLPNPAFVNVLSTPPGARVYVDNQFRGQTPIKLNFPQPGEFRIRTDLEAYEPMARTLQVTNGASMVEEFRLTKNAGKIELVTEPAGVRVLLDGKEIGVTPSKAAETDQISDPLVLDPVSVGAHTLRLTRKGYEDAQLDVTVQRDQTATAHQQLKRVFLKNYEVRTDTRTYKGFLLSTDKDGSVKMEVSSGIIKTIKAADIRFKGPLKEEGASSPAHAD